jgi:uncharacterized pyridoxamine 5'-phosphate oxidase family protein
MENNRALNLISGPWDEASVRQFIESTIIPIRLATNGKTNPLVQSLWFLFADDAIWCCTQNDAVVAKRLRKDPNCAFEISADQPPYRGIRGSGRAELIAPAAGELLPKLLDRYSISRNSQLATWLLARVDHEVAVRIDNLSITSWDYSSRM